MLTCQVVGGGVKIVFTSFWDEAKTHQDTQADTRQTRPSYGECSSIDIVHVMAEARRARFLQLVHRQELKRALEAEAEQARSVEVSLLNSNQKPYSFHKKYSASMRPLYLNIPDSIHDVNTYGHPYQQDQGFPKVNATRRNYSEALSQTWPISQGKLSTRKLAILEPLDHQYQYGMFKVYDSEAVAPLQPHNAHPYVSVHPSNVGNNGNLPPLDWRHQARWLPDQQYDPVRIQDSQRPSRWSKRPEETHRRQPG
ncbi:hypothetical protein J6590_006393 [Homalodisca vitripennis]|nr:hypothetical protein J6590_006393 [Homalodisca vitripennis]